MAKLCDLSSAAPLADTLPHCGRNPNPNGGGGGGGGGRHAAEAEAEKDELAGALRWGADMVLHAVRQLSSSPAVNSWTPVGTLAWMAPEMMAPHYQVRAPAQPAAWLLMRHSTSRRSNVG